MKFDTISKEAYVAAHGQISSRGPSPETLALWARIQKLTVVEYMVIEPERGEDVLKLRNNLGQKLAKLVKNGANFKLRMVTNKSEKHIVIWKEPKVR